MSLLLVIGSIIIVNASSFVGFFLPPLVELLNKDVKSDAERYIVAVIVCFLVAILLHGNEIVNGTPQNIMLFVGVLFLESTTVFKLYFKNSWLRQSIQTRMTSGDTPTPPPEEGGGQ